MKSSGNRQCLFGPHTCIGNRFALMEGQLLLAMMLQRYDVTELKQLDEGKMAVTMRPKYGLPVRITPRNQ